jgi:Protein of unknown function (DUF3455)
MGSNAQSVPPMHRNILTGSLLIVVAACASQQSIAAPPVPGNLEPPATEVALRTLAARGVQIYECRLKEDDPQAAQWALVAPEADLFDAQGRQVGKHYAGPQWESLDGSKVIGAVKARADAPRAGSIPWLLMTTKSVGPAGAFASATSVQRINTAGGTAPAAEGCTPASIGKQARMAYSADYVMFEGK